ncbi:uncharacterized protein LOC113349738 [Papaver somniferum]|uniref:uncharacterized protein LOC113349738 n=1 Tax=Papaver somniferum TaxID=3469 RepID=UPI000E6FAC85|nr:uncharacterized protein LOC113349738 [Papaver somniferum]
MGNYSFKEKYPRIYRISIHKKSVIAEVFNTNWNLLFTREVDPSERIDLLELKFELRNLVLSPDGEDEIQGEATSKAVLRKLSSVGDDWEGFTALETKFAPPKVCFILWAAMHNSVPTRDMLQHRGVDISSVDCLYCNDVEILDHLFLECSWARHLWNYFLSSIQVRWVMPGCFSSFLLSWRLQSTSRRRNFVWRIVPFAVCWELWLERNRRVHGGRAKSKDELIYAVILGISLWSSNTDIFRGFTTNQILHNWEDVMAL